jgi:hypothetical protein
MKMTDGMTTMYVCLTARLPERFRALGQFLWPSAKQFVCPLRMVVGNL